MKTKEELNALKEEIKTMNQKLAELTEEELAQVTGGAVVRRVDVQATWGAAVEVALDSTIDMEASQRFKVEGADLFTSDQLNSSLQNGVK